MAIRDGTSLLVTSKFSEVKKEESNYDVNLNEKSINLFRFPWVKSEQEEIVWSFQKSPENKSDFLLNKEIKYE